MSTTLDLTSAPPLPDPDATTEPFWSACLRHELTATSCGACGRLQIVSGARCHNCGSSDLSRVSLSGRGTIYTFVVVDRAFHPYFASRVPYAIGTVALAEHPDLRLFTRLLADDLDELAIGAPVAVEFDDVADGVSLPLFRVIEAAS